MNQNQNREISKISINKNLEYKLISMIIFEATKKS